MATQLLAAAQRVLSSRGSLLVRYPQAPIRIVSMLFVPTRSICSTKIHFQQREFVVDVPLLSPGDDGALNFSTPVSRIEPLPEKSGLVAILSAASSLETFLDLLYDHQHLYTTDTAFFVAITFRGHRNRIHFKSRGTFKDDHRIEPFLKFCVEHAAEIPAKKLSSLAWAFGEVASKQFLEGMATHFQKDMFRADAAVVLSMADSLSKAGIMSDEIQRRFEDSISESWSSLQLPQILTALRVLCKLPTYNRHTAVCVLNALSQAIPALSPGDLSSVLASMKPLLALLKTHAILGDLAKFAEEHIGLYRPDELMRLAKHFCELAVRAEGLFDKVSVVLMREIETNRDPQDFMKHVTNLIGSFCRVGYFNDLLFKTFGNYLADRVERVPYFAVARLVDNLTKLGYKHPVLFRAVCDAILRDPHAVELKDLVTICLSFAKVKYVNLPFMETVLAVIVEKLPQARATDYCQLMTCLHKLNMTSRPEYKTISSWVIENISSLRSSDFSLLLPPLVDLADDPTCKRLVTDLVLQRVMDDTMNLAPKERARELEMVNQLAIDSPAATRERLLGLMLRLVEEMPERILTSYLNDCIATQVKAPLLTQALQTYFQKRTDSVVPSHVVSAVAKFVSSVKDVLSQPLLQSIGHQCRHIDSFPDLLSILKSMVVLDVKQHPIFSLVEDKVCLGQPTGPASFLQRLTILSLFAKRGTPVSELFLNSLVEPLIPLPVSVRPFDIKRMLLHYSTLTSLGTPVNDSFMRPVVQAVEQRLPMFDVGTLSVVLFHMKQLGVASKRLEQLNALLPNRRLVVEMTIAEMASYIHYSHHAHTLKPVMLLEVMEEIIKNRQKDSISAADYSALISAIDCLGSRSALFLPLLHRCAEDFEKHCYLWETVDVVRLFSLLARTRYRNLAVIRVMCNWIVRNKNALHDISINVAATLYGAMTTLSANNERMFNVLDSMLRARAVDLSPKHTLEVIFGAVTSQRYFNDTVLPMLQHCEDRVHELDLEDFKMVSLIQLALQIESKLPWRFPRLQEETQKQLSVLSVPTPSVVAKELGELLTAQGHVHVLSAKLPQVPFSVDVFLPDLRLVIIPCGSLCFFLGSPAMLPLHQLKSRLLQKLGYSVFMPSAEHWFKSTRESKRDHVLSMVATARSRNKRATGEHSKQQPSSSVQAEATVSLV
eukprot:GILK01007058.1.p1 GENE.GILK01007058.1~~GILK01007058.1.p1  ORF type:complete len:1186 (-),score=201.24 GILK01007058.1:150-3662(-)